MEHASQEQQELFNLCDIRRLLLQELKRSGPDNPALSMLVEPLLPRAWRKELDQQKLLKGD